VETGNLKGSETKNRKLIGTDNKKLKVHIRKVAEANQSHNTPIAVWTQRLEEKSSYLCRGSNLVRPVVQSVARHYPDSATPTSSEN
jgi:hypothetical protein